MSNNRKSAPTLKGALQILAILFGAIPLCFGLGMLTTSAFLKYVCGANTHDPGTWLWGSIINYFFVGFWMYAIFFVPRWIYDYIRFKRFVARAKSDIPVSCDAFYGMEPDQGGFETLEFQRGAIYFSSGAIFETRNRAVFNRIQKKCEEMNPLFRTKQCPLTPSETMGWHPPNGFIRLEQ